MFSLEKIRPLRFTIYGKYWDSQSYSDSLYLFTLSGALHRIRWESLLEELQIETDLKIAAQLALLGNDSLYETGARQLLRDPEIQAVLSEKFRRLSERSGRNINLKDEWLQSQDNPLPFPHNDSDIHYGELLAGSSRGLYGIKWGNTSRRRRKRSNAVHYNDTPALRIAARFHSVAQAAGTEGLYEVPVFGSETTTRFTKLLSAVPCLSCEWAFESVIASGYDSNVYLAAFRRIQPVGRPPGSRRVEREFDRVVDNSEIFNTNGNMNTGVTWGARDKIFRLTGSTIQVVRYTPGTSFHEPEQINLGEENNSGPIVSARVAPFGSVLEYDDGLLVVTTQSDLIRFKGEPTNWRVFPRSDKFVNHLHIIYEDRIEIVVFMHDYFVDQTEKLAGISASSITR